MRDMLSLRIPHHLHTTRSTVAGVTESLLPVCVCACDVHHGCITTIADPTNCFCCKNESALSKIIIIYLFVNSSLAFGADDKTAILELKTYLCMIKSVAIDFTQEEASVKYPVGLVGAYCFKNRSASVSTQTTSSAPVQSNPLSALVTLCCSA